MRIFLIVSMTLVLAAGTLVAKPALAEFGEDGALVNLPLYLELSGSWAYSTISGQSVSASTTLTGFQGGVTVAGVLGGSFLLGVSTDYYTMTQYSTVVSSDGNFTGTRWNVIAPMIGVKFNGFVLKADYQFLGNYQLSNQTAQGGSIYYGNPGGFRFRAQYQVLSHVYAGAFYEAMSYGKRVNSQTGETLLSPSFSASNLGLYFALGF